MAPARRRGKKAPDKSSRSAITQTAREALFQDSLDGLIVLDGEDALVEINATAAAILGVSPEEVQNLPASQVVTSQGASLDGFLVKAASQPAVSLVRGGQVRQFSLRTLRVKGEGEADEGRLIIFRDVTDWARAQVTEQATRQMAEEHADAIRQALRRERQLHEITRVISSSTDIDAILESIVESSAELVDADAAELALLDPDGDTLTITHSYNAPDTPVGKIEKPSEEKTLPWIILESSEGVRIGVPDTLPPELTARGVSGLIGVPLMAGETPLGILSLYITSPKKQFDSHDLSAALSVGRQAGIAIQNARLFEEIQQLATTDPLTGIANRRHFFEFGVRELEGARRYDRKLSVLMLDIDHFKLVNDSHGHAAGDRVLQALADHCQDSLRRADLLCRYGGEEFAFLLPETGLESARLTAERLRVGIEAMKIDTGNSPVSVTVSLGVVQFTGGDDRLEDLLDKADQALYVAKQSGRNRVKVWGQDAQE